MLTKRTIDAALNKIAADESKWYDGVKNWATADNYSNLKNVGIGAGTALATYGLTSLLPNSHKHKGKRLASAIIAGSAAGYYGKDIRDYVESKAHLWRGNTAKQQETADSDQKATDTENHNAVSPPMPKVLPVVSPPMPKVLPVTPAPKDAQRQMKYNEALRSALQGSAPDPSRTLLENALASSGIPYPKASQKPVVSNVKGKPVVSNVKGTSGTKFRALLDEAKAAPVGPTLANAAALKAAEIKQRSEKRQKAREVIKNLRSKINDPVQVTTHYGPGPSSEEVASSNAARKAALVKKKKKEQELKNKAIADEYAKRLYAQAKAPYSPAPTADEIRRARARQQQKLTQDALRRGR